MRPIDRIGFKDKRKPMHRLLAQEKDKGYICPEYHQQWQTFFKAIKLKLIVDIDDTAIGKLTEKGIKYLERGNNAGNK